MANKLRAVLVGCGGISHAWLDPIVKRHDIEMVGLVDIRREAAEEKKAKFNLTQAQIGEDLAAMLKQVKPDVVFDCTIPEVHVQVVLTALSHGCHVLGEKPLADSMENACRMVAAATKAQKIYAVIQNRRFDQNAMAIRDFIASGRIGKLTTLNCDFLIGAHFGGFRDRMKHVLLLDMAIHTFDAARMLSGTDPVSVYCHEWNPEGSWYGHDASAIAVFEMSNGVVFTYRGSWCAEGLNTTWESNWHAIATRGSAEWNGADQFRAQAVKKTGGFFSEMEDVTIPVALDPAFLSGHAGLIDDFVKAVQTESRPVTIASDNIKSLAMVFGAIESAEAHRPISIKI